MSSKTINSRDNKIKECDFYKNKNVAKVDDIDVSKILVSKKEPYGTKNSFKYFIRYNDNDFIRQLCIKLSPMTGYVRTFEINTAMSFNISNKQLLKKYNQIRKRVEKLLKIDGDDDKYIKTKIIMYNGIMFTNFQCKKIPKEKAPCKCLSIIMLDSVIKTKKKILSSNTLGRM